MDGYDRGNETEKIIVMERKERRVLWAPASIERDKITRMLPRDWVTERDVTVGQPNGETRRFRFDEVLASRLQRGRPPHIGRVAEECSGHNIQT